MTATDTPGISGEPPKVPLATLVAGIESLVCLDHKNPLIKGLAYHSGAVKPGDLFVCIRGRQDDGHRYAHEAVVRGAVAVVVERRIERLNRVAQVQATDGRRALAHLAARFYEHPSAQLRIIGVTGTEGKTTTTHLVDAILRAAGRSAGLLGTIVNRVGTTVRAATLTTPESLDLQRLLWECVRAGVSDVVMEVSSHALAQARVAECEFDVAVFTNLHSDHLDFHGKRAQYLYAKAGLFSALGRGAAKAGRGLAVLNADEPVSRRMAAVCGQPVLRFGLKRRAEVRGRILQSDLGRTVFWAETPAGPLRGTVGLTGAFNVSNALAASTVALAVGVDPKAVMAGLEGLKGIPGRFELVPNDRGLLIVVDFAHTLAAYAAVLPTLRRFSRGRLITVFGCPGDRDRTHRAPIGRLVTRLSDFMIVTTDNPADEDPAEIAAEIGEGARQIDPHGERRRVILDRREAVRAALALARAGDAVLLAGKGHEEYQIVEGRRLSYNDRRTVEEILGR
ncbi:MAG: UDP-N-acetylmuramoyl-L-alanyl-D-glutamate--2,6-diaminopimelate ligase [Candidatus Methylomirabilia bacterium]